MTELHKELDDILAPVKRPLVRGDIKPVPAPTPTSNPQLEQIERTITAVRHLFDAKNAEYAGSSSDILGNFRRQAGNMGVPMSTVWMILAGKHIDAIQEYVKDCRGDVLRPRTQSVGERVDDLIVYALLLKVILAEEGNP